MKTNSPNQSPIKPIISVAFLFLLIIALGRGAAFLFIKIGVQSIPILSLVFLRVSIAAALLLAFVFFNKYTFPKERNDWFLLILIGVVGNIIPFSLVGYAELTLDSGITGVLIALVPIFVFILGHIFTKDEKLNVNKSIGALIGFFGVILLSSPPISINPKLYFVAILAGIGAAFSYSAATIIAKKLGKIEPSVISASVLSIAAVILLPIALIVDFPLSTEITSISIASVIALAVISTAIPFVLMYRLIASKGASFFTLSNYLIPIVAVLLGIAVLDEHIRLAEMLGIAVILVGIALCSGKMHLFGNKPRTSKSY